MSDDKPKKPVFHRPNQKPRDTFMPPETMGEMKRDNPFHWSLDELIEYKMTGVRPKMIIDEDMVYKMASYGISIKNICGVFEITEETFCNNSAFLSAHQSGRSNCGTRVRAMIVQHAENGSLDAAKYLDKILGGDIVQESVNLNITQRPLEQVNTEQLIEIAFKEKNNDN